jgi:hypothetical protein
MSNDFYDEKGPIDLTDKEQANFWERQTKGMSKALSEFKAIVRAKSEQIKELEAKLVLSDSLFGTLSSLCDDQQSKLQESGDEMQVMCLKGCELEAKNIELERKLVEMTNRKDQAIAAYETCEGIYKYFEKNLKIAVDALEYFALDTDKYDRELANEALKKIEEK